MLEPRSLIRIWGPPSAVVDEVTGDVSINIGGVVIETSSRAYDARQKLADEANADIPTTPVADVMLAEVTPQADAQPAPPDDASAASKDSVLSKLLGKTDAPPKRASKAPPK